LNQYYINKNSALLKEQTRIKQMLDIENVSKEPLLLQHEKEEEEEEVEPCNRAACHEQKLIREFCLVLLFFFFLLFSCRLGGCWLTHVTGR
jgi:hypothetical protein